MLWKSRGSVQVNNRLFSKVLCVAVVVVGSLILRAITRFGGIVKLAVLFEGWGLRIAGTGASKCLYVNTPVTGRKLFGFRSCWKIKFVIRKNDFEDVLHKKQLSDQQESHTNFRVQDGRCRSFQLNLKYKLMRNLSLANMSLDQIYFRYKYSHWGLLAIAISGFYDTDIRKLSCPRQPLGYYSQNRSTMYRQKRWRLEEKQKALNENPELLEEVSMSNTDLTERITKNMSPKPACLPIKATICTWGLLLGSRLPISWNQCRWSFFNFIKTKWFQWQSIVNL